MICANKIITITPQNNWKLNCALPGSCSGLQLTLNVGYIERIDSLTFTGMSSGANANIVINTGAMMMGMIELNDIRCENYGSCNGLTVTLGAGVDFYNTNVDCQQMG